MKNIHTLQTDKTSRLLFNSSYESFCFQKEENGMFINDGKVSNASFWTIEKAQSNGFKPHHIYITSDEEIKVGDCYLTFTNKEVMGQPRKCEDANWNFSFCKKIILTTDQSLEGVQSIDDDFLEWFVKNPSCESVDVKRNYLGSKCLKCGFIENHDEVETEDCPKCHNTTYEHLYNNKIIIPQEEPKQDTYEEEYKKLFNL
jgi:ssDNA-binding Zn-finger/Zn-ribbon topoisomerase 1